MASEPHDTHFSASQAAAAEDDESLTPLEQEVLDEYARLLENLNTVCFILLFFSPGSSFYLSTHPHTYIHTYTLHTDMHTPRNAYLTHD
jgi:hypothetical protein